MFEDMWSSLSDSMAAAGVPPPPVVPQQNMAVGMPGTPGQGPSVWDPATADPSDPGLAEAKGDSGMSEDPMAAAAKAPMGGPERLAAALRGMAPPKVAPPQHVSTPATSGRPPADRTAHQSLMDLLMMSQAARPKPTLQLPSTLATALGGR